MASGFHVALSPTFSVGQGESFGLVGESGSGKSTVLRTLAGLNEDWSGTVMVDGKPLGRRRDREFHRRVQMVFQDPYGSLHPRQTVDRLLSEPLLIHGIGDNSTTWNTVQAKLAQRFTVIDPAPPATLVLGTTRESGLWDLAPMRSTGY